MADPAPELTVSQLHRDGRSLVLRVVGAEELSCPRLILARASDGDNSRLATIEMSPELRAKLLAGIEFVDPEPPPSAKYQFQCEGDEAGQTTSRIVEGDADLFPPKPEVSLHAVADRAIALDWRPAADASVVSRRDLLQDGPFRELASLPDSEPRYEDVKVAPGGVYAYRVSLVRLRDGVAYRGEESDDIYATVPSMRATNGE